MTDERAIAVRRVLAFFVDWFVIALWGGVLFGVVMIATGGNPPRAANPWRSEFIGFIAMTLPVTLYFALCESSGMRASLGKRLLGLSVIAESGSPLTFGSALVRNAVKFIPWEFGHLVAQQAFFAGERGVPVWVWGAAAISMLGPVWWIVSLFSRGRTPYDAIASARVKRASEPVLSIP